MAARPSSGFHTTRWSVVVRAVQGPRGDGEAKVALEQLCGSYWYPLYALGRREGLSAAETEDAVQGFFLALLERADLTKADPERGRFRAFLRTAFRHHLGDLRRRDQALKRGGGQRDVPLDPEWAEARYGSGSGRALEPDALFERAWALALIEGVLEELAASYAARGRGAWFEALRPALVGDTALPSQAELAEQLGATEGAVKAASHRLRERFREALLRAVGDTLDEPEREGDREDARRRELAALFAALGGA